MANCLFPNGKFDLSAFNLTPVQIKGYLDYHIVGQEEAKITLATAICSHYKRLQYDLLMKRKPVLNSPKSNALLIGSTGTGKTAMIKVLSSYLGIPMVEFNAPDYTEQGYVGDDVDNIPRTLYARCGDIELAQLGIIYIDEIDKIAKNPNNHGSDISDIGVQNDLLKIVEGAEIGVQGTHNRDRDLNQVIRTHNMLFVLSGAFDGLEEIVNRRKNPGSIGFGAALKEQAVNEVSDLQKSDLVSYGFNSQFIDRIPYIAVLSNLNEDQMFKILKLEENPILSGKKAEFATFGIALHFEDEALRLYARMAASSGQSARDLPLVINKSLLKFYFRLPSVECAELNVTAELVKDPDRILSEMLEGSVPRIFEKKALKKIPVESAETIRLRTAYAQALADRVKEEFVAPATEYCMHKRGPPSDVVKLIDFYRDEIIDYCAKITANFDKKVRFPEDCQTILIAACLKEKRPSVANLINQKMGRYLENQEFMEKVKSRDIVITPNEIYKPELLVSRTVEKK